MTITTEVTPPGPAGLAHLKMVIRGVAPGEVSSIERQVCSALDTSGLGSSYSEASRVLTLQCFVRRPETEDA